MNLNAVAQSMTRAITPPMAAYLLVSTGSTANADYSRQPTFSVFPVVLDVQAMSASALEHMDALNIQGIFRTAYFNGLIEGLDRPAGKGGDLVTFTTGRLAGQTWKCVQPLENWDTAGPTGWVKVVIQLQANPTPAEAAAIGAAIAAATTVGVVTAVGSAAGSGNALGIDNG